MSPTGSLSPTNDNTMNDNNNNNTRHNNNTSPRTSQLLQQILDEDETDDTSQFLDFLQSNNNNNNIDNIATATTTSTISINDDNDNNNSNNTITNNNNTNIQNTKTIINDTENITTNNNITNNNTNINTTMTTTTTLPSSNKNNNDNNNKQTNYIPKPSRSSFNRAEVEVAMLVKAAPSITILSPLEVKRRIRKKKDKYTTTIINSNQQQQQRQRRKKTKSFSVGTSKLESISKLLVKNAQFKHNGPGLPTSIAVHSKFLAIGTSHSLIIVFDHFQEVRIVLGDWKKSRDGVVTSIDVSWDSDFLIAGYQSGKIILWNILTGKEEKILNDAHDCPVVNLRFWPSNKNSLSAASLDIKGRINLLTFNKRLFTWYVDRRCLVNESTGSKIALSVLPPAPDHVLQNIEKSKQDGFKAAFELLIFSSHTSTIIVALNP